MNLKKEISRFRSEVLIGEYESAIGISKDILAQLEVYVCLTQADGAKDNKG